MDEKIKSLWTNNKILFFILLPLIIIAVAVLVFRDLILSALIGSARKVSGEAKGRDEALKESLNKAEVEAAVAQSKADEAAKRVNDRKESDIDEDWNKK